MQRSRCIPAWVGHLRRINRPRATHRVQVTVAPGDCEPHMQKTAEIDDPRILSEPSLRVRKRRHDLIPLLDELAYNLRWSWDPRTRDLFQSLAPEPWTRTSNPIPVLKLASAEPDRLAEHAESILD